MVQKPSYKELELKVKKLKDEISKLKAADKRRAIERRHLAEEILRGKPEADEDLSWLSPEAKDRLTFELRIRQIELEMQNEELRTTQLDLEAQRDKYSDLYDFAPVGYFTTSEKGKILEANLTGAVMLGIERGLLIGSPLSRFISRDTQDVFHFHRKDLFEEKSRQTCELKILKKDGTEFHARLESIAVKDEEGNFGKIRTALTDITQQKADQEALQQKTHDLGERVKELNCLYKISRIREKKGISLEEILQGTVDFIPPAWQHPEITCARVILDREVYITENFKEARWRQDKEIVVNGNPAGKIEVFYLEKRPDMDEGPFLKEERNLINVIAERLGGIIKHKRLEEAVQESEKRFRELFNNMNNGVAVYEVKGNGEDFVFKDFNQAGERIDKIKKEELIGKSVIKVFPGVKELGLLEVFRKVWKTGKPAHHPVCMYQDERIMGWRENFVYKLPSGEVVAVYSDETERRKAEEALRESENRYKRLVEGSPDIVYIYSDKRGASYWSQRVHDILGFSPDDLRERPFLWHDSIHPDDLPKVDSIIKGSEREEDFDIEYRIEDIHGNWHWFHDRVIGKHQTGGETIIEGLATDITEQKQASEALQKAYGSLELQVARRTDELEKAVESLAQEISVRKQTEKEQALLQQRLESLWKISKMVDANEQTLYDEVLTQIKDLTQSSYAFFGFLNNEESVMSLYSWSKEAIEDCRTSEKPLEFPISKAGLWGEAVRKRRWFIINDYRKNHPAKKGFPDGHVPITRLLAVPIFSHDRIVTLAVVANKETEYNEEDAEQIEAFIANAQILLEWKKTEEARRAAEEELEKQRLRSIRTDRLMSLGEMAAGIAHELNQPLSGVRGLAEHLLIGIDRGWNMKSADHRDKLKVIIEQSDRMSHIIEHVRMFAREAGKPEVRPVNVSDVVNSSLQMLGQQFKSHGLKINSELADGLSVVQVNPFSLEEVILNLLTNARDAVEQRLKTDSTASSLILLKAFTDPEDKKRPLKIQVIDQGAGINQDALLKVFDPFFTTKAPDEGTGLGLSICKSIVEEFGGSIKIESKLNTGTTVTISLPVERN